MACKRGKAHWKLFCFKYKGDKDIVITIPHLLITWPLSPLQSITCCIGRSWCLGGIFFTKEYLFIYGTIQSFRHVHSLISYHLVQCKQRKKFREFVIMMPNSALIWCTLPLMTAIGSALAHLMAEQLSPRLCCPVKRKSSWQLVCLSEERNSKHPSSSCLQKRQVLQQCTAFCLFVF